MNDTSSLFKCNNLHLKFKIELNRPFFMLCLEHPVNWIWTCIFELGLGNDCIENVLFSCWVSSHSIFYIMYIEYKYMCYTSLPLSHLNQYNIIIIILPWTSRSTCKKYMYSACREQLNLAVSRKPQLDRTSSLYY